MSDNEHWHDKEVADIDFGDKRLNKRITSLMNSFLIHLAKAYQS